MIRDKRMELRSVNLREEENGKPSVYPPG